MASAPRGLGGLITTEVERVELGRFGSRELSARVERRRLELGVGGRFGMRLALGRLRPVAVEVREPTGSYEVAVPAVPDPRVTAVRRALLLWAAALAAGWWIDRRRAGRRDRL